MSAPSFSDRVAQLAADPALVGHPVVAGLVVAMEALENEWTALRVRVASQDEELAALRRQLGRHSGNRGQPPSQDGPQAPPRAGSQGGRPAGPCGDDPAPGGGGPGGRGG